MKKIGIVGGVAWQSTVDYYAELCRRSQQWHVSRNQPGEPTFPEISIESLDLAKAISYLGSDDHEQSWSKFDEYHRAALKRLEVSGAEVAVIASNTPHHRFDAIVQGIQIPVISVIEEMAKQSAEIGVQQVLLLGTDLTMKSRKFRDVFERHGIEASGPRSEEARSLTTDLINQLQRGKTQGAAAKLGRIVDLSLDAQPELKPKPAVCLACTELTLAFGEERTLPIFKHDGIVYINSSLVHVNAAFEFAVAE